MMLFTILRNIFFRRKKNVDEIISRLENDILQLRGIIDATEKKNNAHSSRQTPISYKEIIGFMVAIATLYIGYDSLMEFKKQNQLVIKQQAEISKQNQYLQQQTFRTTQSVNIEAVISLIADIEKEREQANQTGLSPDSSWQLPKTLLSRIAAVSKALIPYDTVVSGGKIRFLSAERGYLLKELLYVKAKFPLDPNPIFAYADLRNADFGRSVLKNANLYAADFSDAVLFEADFAGANISNANFFKANLDDANLSSFNPDTWSYAREIPIKTGDPIKTFRIPRTVNHTKIDSANFQLASLAGARFDPKYALIHLGDSLVNIIDYVIFDYEGNPIFIKENGDKIDYDFFNEEKYYLEGESALKNKDYDKVIDNYEKLVSFNPYAVKAYRGLAIANHKENSFHAALEYYSKVIELSPFDTLAFLGRAEIRYFFSKRNDWIVVNENDALADYNRVIELDPNEALAYRGRALIMYDKKDYTSALKDFNKAISLNPNDTVSYYWRAMTNFSTNREKALSDLNKYIAFKKHDSIPYAYHNRALLNHYLGHYQEANHDWNKAIQLNPQDSLAYIYRGVANLNIGNLSKALLDLNKTIEYYPEYSGGYYFRGKVKRNQGSYEEALIDYNKAIQLDPNYTEAYRGRSRIMLQQGNISLAIKDYFKSL